MTSTTIAFPPAAKDRPALVTRPLLLRFASIVGASASFYLPLSVVPVYARSAGGNLGAGLATGALLFATVAAELVTPRLVSRVGYRLALALGLLALGLPALALLGPPRLDVITLVSIVRGAGFAIVTVAGGGLTASLIPPERRGEGLALVGVVSGVPAVTCLPLGVWLSAHWGTSVVFVGTAAVSLLALAVVPGLPDYRQARRSAAHGPAGTLGVLRALRNPALTGPAMLFSASTMALGVLVTFLPLAITGRSVAVASAALFAESAAATVTRFAIGRYGDKRGQTGFLYPGVLLAAAGMASVAAIGAPALVIGGAAIFGVGFGLLQNSTATLMYTRTDRDGYDAVSAIWNAAYDAGMGVGAISVGLITGHLGYPVTFLLIAALVTTALIPARRERRRH